MVVGMCLEQQLEKLGVGGIGGCYTYEGQLPVAKCVRRPPTLLIDLVRGVV